MPRVYYSWTGCVTSAHKTPRRKNKNRGVRKWTQRTPAMAAGLTDHRRTLKELFTTVVVGEQHSAG